VLTESTYAAYSSFSRQHLANLRVPRAICVDVVSPSKRGVSLSSQRVSFSKEEHRV
jgi:hypothetical protein